MDVSPYLSAIQALKGETPGEKYQDLHSVAIRIIESEEEKNNFLKNGTTTRVAAALYPTLRILVGLKLKSKDAVIEALKSDDVSIIKLALGAKWFFNASNDLINVDYFSDKLLPFVSVKTRLELIKVLSKCLKAQQAESFHCRFIELFGSDQALPLLVACSQDYIYDVIIKNKIVLSVRMLKDLYRKYPQIVIRYLRFIKDGSILACSKYASEPLLMRDYLCFLPYLVKNHTQEFIEFYRSIEEYGHKSVQLGNTRAEYFLRKATDVLVEKPDEFIDCLPLKLVKSKLSKQQYDSMLQNLLPKDVKKLTVGKIIYNINQYYPKEEGFELFREHYKKAYDKDLLDHEDLFDDERACEILPPEIKAEYLQKFVNSLTDKSKYWNKVYLLSPKESIPLLKEQIKKSSVLKREDALKYMLQSCNVYKSKEDLLEVLQYYNSRHKNEQAQVLLQWLDCLSDIFDNMSSLDREHWQIIKDIIQRAYVKGHIFLTNWYSNAQRLLTNALHYYLRQCQSDNADEADKVFLDKLIDMILEFYCEHNRKWDFITYESETEEVCLEKFLLAVPQKYPESHVIWKKNENQLTMTSYFIKRMGKFNEKNLQAPLDPKVKASMMMIEYYPWLAKSATELFIDKAGNLKSKIHASFKESLRTYFPQFYQNIIDEHSDMINDVTTDDAVIILKHDRKKILSKINEYILGCRFKLEIGRRSTKRFVTSLKWYQDIPLKFVEKCLAEIQEKANVLILGMLLEGEVLSKIVEPYLPKETTLEIESENAKKEYELVASLPRALNYTNPPPSLETLIPLCKGDYLSVALQTLSSIAQRIPIDRVLSFSNHLTKNAISVRKAGIRLVFQVSPKPQAREFLKKLCKEEKNPGVREVIAKMVFDVFTQTPSPDSWQLMKEFIQDLLHDDKNIYEILQEISSVSIDYISDYILEIFKKINSFSEEDISEDEKSSLILSFVNEFSDKNAFNKLPEDLITEIITKHLFGCSSNLIFGIYLFSDEHKFEGRLKLFMDIISENLAQLDKTESHRPRNYPILKKVRSTLSGDIVFSHLKRNENKEMIRQFITSILSNDLLKKVLDCFINFNICQVYIDSSDANDFGKKCGENVDSLIKIYNTELIIEHYGENLSRFVSNSSYEDQQFDIIDGLQNHAYKYGVLIGLKFLSTWGIKSYDERYDQFVEAAKNSDDILVQAFIYNFLADIHEFNA